uniref:NUC153 domain-containing protein n=1 Tax=Strigamia maritima TaxID=126957 RepID=T1JGF9_STRMM
MHGYFVDARLYRKAKSADVSFNYSEYRQKRIREKLDAERTSRVKINKLPTVNRKLAEKLIASESTKTDASAIMQDDRFASLFTDPDFQVDEESDEFRLLNPLIKHNERKQLKKIAETRPEFEEAEAESGSSDDDRAWVQETKRQHKLVKHENREKRRQEDAEAKLEPSFYSLRPGEEFKVGSRSSNEEIVRQSLGDRLSLDEKSERGMKKGHNALCHREVSFKIGKKTKNQTEPHIREVRSARGLGSKLHIRGRGRGRGRGRH